MTEPDLFARLSRSLGWSVMPHGRQWLAVVITTHGRFHCSNRDAKRALRKALKNAHL